MRFAIALVTLLIAGVLVATGVAQRTILKPEDHLTVAASGVPSDVRYVVIPGAVLQSHDGQQKLQLSGGEVAFAAYGRSSDVVAWLSGQRYAQLGIDDRGALTEPAVRTAPVINGLKGGAPDPDGADLWIDQRRSTSGTLDWPVDVPKGMSVIVASTGAAAAPSDIRVTWPLSTGTPLAVPLIVAGGALAVVGLLLYLWALVHVRRQRGPRRKPPGKMPKRPQPPKYRPQRPTSAAPAPGRGRRSVRQRVAVAGGGLAAVLVGGLLLPGPATAATAPTPSGASLTEEQATRIVKDAAKVGAASDKALDAKSLATRFTGAALDLRTASYTVRKKDKKWLLPAAIPTTDPVVRLLEPEATTSWPRTLFATVAQGESKTVAPVSVALVQNDPRSSYKVQYAVRLVRNATTPTLPSALVGARRLAPVTPLLEIEPAKLGAAYGSVLIDSGSASASLFSTVQDQLLKQVGEGPKKALAKKAANAKITYKDLDVDPNAVIAMSTANSGALVAVQVSEQQTTKPKKTGVTIYPSGGTKILSKTKSSTKGIQAVYGYQLLFAVPSAGSKERVVLLGYDQGLVSAKEL